MVRMNGLRGNSTGENSGACGRLGLVGLGAAAQQGSAAAQQGSAATLGVCQEGALLSEGRAAAQQGRVATLKANFAKIWFLAWGFKP